MSGVDLKAIVQGRELLSVQLLETRLLLNMAPDPPGGKELNRILLKLNIKNINVIDLQVLTKPRAGGDPHSMTQYLLVRIAALQSGPEKYILWLLQALHPL